jgi:hypothetical protein
MVPQLKRLAKVGLAVASVVFSLSFGVPLPKAWIQSTLDNYGIEADSCRVRIAFNAQPFEVRCFNVKKTDELSATCEYLSIGFTLQDIAHETPSRITIDGVQLNLGGTPAHSVNTKTIESALAVAIASSLTVVEFKNTQLTFFGQKKTVHLNKAKISLNRQKNIPHFYVQIQKQGARQEAIKIDYDAQKKEVALHFERLDWDSWLQVWSHEHTVKLGSPLTGEALITLGDDWLSTKISGRLSTIQPGSLFLNDLYPNGLSFHNIQASVEGSLEDLAGSVSITTTHPKAYVQFSALSDQGVWGRKIILDGQVEGLPHHLFSSHWPEKLGADTRSWVMENLSQGEVPLASIHLEFERQEDAWNVAAMNGSMTISNMTVDYMDGLPKVHNVDGTAEFNKSQFVIKVARGELDDLVVEEGRLNFYNLDKERALASIQLKVQGPLQQALQVADSGDLKYPTSLGVNPLDVKGEAVINLSLEFPLRENITSQDIQIKILSTLEKLSFIKPLPDPLKELTIQNGMGSLSLNNTEMLIECESVAWGIPIQVRWLEKFKLDSKIQRQMSLSGHLLEKQRANLKIPEIPGIHKDYGCQLIHTTHVDGKEPLTLTLDLTQAHIDASAFFQKTVNDPASLAVSFADIRKGLAQDMALTYKDTRGEILGNLRLDSNLAPLEFKNIHLDFNGNQLWGSWTRHESGWKLFVDAKVLDVQPYLAQLRDSGKETEWFGDISFKADALKIGENKQLKKVKGIFNRKGSVWHHIDFTAEPKTSIKLSTQPTGRDFQLETTATPTIMAIVMDGDKITSGKTTLTLSQAASIIDPWIGHLHMSQAGVKDMPFLAKILSILSPVAVAEMLSGKGLVFGDIEADVSIKDKHLHISHAEATSMALGIAFLGHIHMGHKTIAIQGNVIPAYVMNSLIGKIPLVGNMITGGKGQGLISAGFTITGTFDDCVTKVNPLSILAPGFIRKIFETDLPGPKQGSQPNHP